MKSVNSRFIAACAFALALCCGPAQAQESSNTSADVKSGVENKLSADAFTASAQIAMSNAGYLVTPGDVYTLAYAAGNMPVSYTILVDTTYRIRVSNLGILDATGMTFIGLKKQVEAIVTKNYPMSGVQFVLLTPAVFQVTVKGEVKSAIEKKAWPLSRLSELLVGNTTPYSSFRDVMVTSTDGKTRTCDLYKAQRFGDFAQDPYVRPGDVITVRHAERVVTITGAVERPGTYQLLAGENFNELVRDFASGFSPTADPSRIELTRYIGSQSVSGDKVYLEWNTAKDDYSLQNFDAVLVSSITELLPVMYVEGSIGSTVGIVPETSTRVAVRFNKGENYANMIRRNRAWFSSVSDTKNAYILRGQEKLLINLDPMLYDADYRSPYILEKDDVLMIPFRQYFVTVSGSVTAPGRYPYIPDRAWDYYVALAGGFIAQQNTGDAVEIKDFSGKLLTKNDPITPETIIKAQNNSFTFVFKEYSPVITVVLSAISTVLTAIALAQ